MDNRDPIEKDDLYKRLCKATSLIGLNPVDRVLFLSTFESWYYFQNYELYKSLTLKAIEAVEEMKNT